jgi:pyrimidine operon attenuation protein/uracil phosphoribosyltransferase
MDLHEARTMSTQEEMKAKVGICQEKMEATIHSIWSELEERIKHWVEDVLLCINQKMQYLCKELTNMIEEIQVDLQAAETSLDSQTKSLQETPEDMKNDLHEEAQTMKHEIRINQERMKVKTEAT